MQQHQLVPDQLRVGRARFLLSPLSSAGSVEELRQLSRGARGGSDPLVVMAAHGPHTSPAELAELTDLVERLTFVAPR